MQSHFSFMRDKYLKDLAASIDEYEVISFDAFDTLLFRTVYEPVEVFLTLGKYMHEEFPEYRDTPVEVLQHLRMEAERRAHEKARQNGVESVTLERIYDELHIWGDNRRRIMELEMQSEREHIYANPHMYSLARYCHEKGKKLAVTSDFYLTRDKLRGLIEYAGVDCGIFAEILVSCDHGVTKGGGHLFERLLEKFPGVPAGRILHIGDNQWSDILPAHKFGLCTLWYPVVPETKGVPIDMERVCYGSKLGALASLRSLAMSTLPEEPFDADDCFWFREGAGIIGPVYALFAEWVVDEALKENIKHVLCFMREGRLLAEVIRRAAENRGVDLHVEPIYVSRRATVLLPKSVNLEDEIRKAFNWHRSTIRDLFGCFYLNAEETPFCDILNTSVRECKESGVFEDISDYLLHNSTLTKIKKEIADQRELFLEYVRSFLGDNAAITVDFLCSGTTQLAVANTLKSCEFNNRVLNLLGLGSSENIRILIDGMELCGWLGYAGLNSDIADLLISNAAALEAMILAKTGSVFKYRYGSGKVIPVLTESEYSQSELRAKDSLWQGVHHFQSYWFELTRLKPKLPGLLIQDTRSAAPILQRLLLSPLNEEALRIGGFSFNDTFVQSITSTVSQPDDIKYIRQYGNTSIFANYSNILTHRVLWPHAAVEQQHPHYYLIEYFRHKYLGAKSYINSSLINVFAILRPMKDNPGRMAIFGLGTRGCKLAEALWLTGFPADIIVDNSADSWGCIVYGAEVMSPAASVGLVDTYIISSAIHAEEMIDEIRKLYNGKYLPNIIFEGK